MPPPIPAADDPVFSIEDFDPSADPGVDFFSFANGGWIAANPVPDDYPRWGSFDEVRKANDELLKSLLEEAAAEPGPPDTVRHWVGAYYRSGMDTAAIERAGLGPLTNRLARIDQIQSGADLVAVAADLVQYGVSSPVSLGVAPDFEDSQRNLLYLGQGGLGLPERDYYFREDAEAVDTRDAYRELIARLLELAGEPDPTAAAAAVLGFETALAEAAFTATQLRDPDLTFNRFDAGALDGLMTGLDGFLHAAGAAGYQNVNIGNPGFLSAAAGLLDETPPATLQRYARWRLLGAAASGLPVEFEEASFEFYGRRLGGQKRQKERWQRVLRAAGIEIPQLVAQLYVAAAFPPEAKARIDDLVSHLLAAMRASIESLQWMGPATKEAALAKLAAFTPKLGYPDQWRDHTGLAIDDGPWVTARFQARSFEFHRRLRGLHDPVDPHEWEMGAHEVNAYYHPLRNEIVFPAGILQPPFFSPDADDAVNYGAIGAVIGHEITHGFDDKGSRFDADGHLANWWTDEDRAEFEKRAAVLVGQFNGYEVLPDLTVNGELTLGENIADLGGLSIAYRALQEVLDETGREAIGGLTPEQRFFLAFAREWRINPTEEYLRLIVQSDPHAPSRFRCNGTVGNMAEFAAAFGLGPEAPLVRDDAERAAIW
ncbi:MAG: M13 family metallopeptidase [Acidimicrobiia bacterium]|nr:M13 family metallopeptidase [Acidimicrobiia bacterium]NNF11081.1 M13 family metallopeptidase [Acidimicrobiia bacterium]NNL69920.1 M13 family metallopeptidase [Acidimicrobiia bacterium]